MLIGCESKELSKDESEKVFSHNIDLSKEQIKIKLLQYVNETFSPGKVTIQTNDDGFLACAGTFQLPYIPTIGYYQYYSKLVFMVKYLDGNYRVKYVIKDIYLDGPDGKKRYPPSSWDNLKDGIATMMKSEDIDLYSYMLNNNNNF
jgi:hypothetical protein